MSILKTAILVGIAAGFLPGLLMAQSVKDEDLQLDTYSTNIAANPMGICLRPTAWTPSLGVAHCDVMATALDGPAPGLGLAGKPSTRLTGPNVRPRPGRSVSVAQQRRSPAMTNSYFVVTQRLERE